VGTEKSANIAVASSYSERVDSEAYAGQYIKQSISPKDLEMLKKLVIAHAGLQPSAKAEGYFVKDKEKSPTPPTEEKLFHKQIGN
jgi:hypothetical protein